MDIFKTIWVPGGKVDLDDLSLYPAELREMNVHDLFNKCTREAGNSLFYMDFLHPGWDDDPGGQKERVVVLCKELSEIWHYVRQFEPDAPTCTMVNEDEYRLALMKWMYRFEDETENQC